MITRTMIPAASQPDSELVDASLSGNRDAFGHIVSRYQSLICSLAYSATGSLSQSEDLAQDTFVTAWKQLRDLREPEKLRAWLCGIARNLINNTLRKQGREPSHRAEPLEEISGGPSPEPLPIETTISKEEAAILWRSLERIPEIYREPLILFYREHQSIEIVALNLDLTEDAVKQRLSRGRKLLQEQFLAFVEGALAKTNPGPNFTCSVLAALPALSLSAKAAAFGGAAVKGSVVAKGAGMLGILGAILTPLLAIFGNYASYRISINEAQSEQERRNIKKLFLSSLIAAAVLSTLLSVPLYWILGEVAHHSPALFVAILISQFIVLYFLAIFVSILATLPRRKRYLATILSEKYAGNYPKAAFEYRSRANLFGWPLIHVRIGDRFDVIRGPVKAWIAIGSSHAVGLIFASGGLAIAPISFGGIAIGLLPFGALALGALSVGAGSLGIWAYGGLAIGWQTFCGCGLAWHSATGGIVAARDFALGGFAHAAQANNEIADRFFQQDLFSHVAKTVADHGFLMMLLWVIPVTLQSRIIARARRSRELATT
jgi:RNA polymerase sigma factor (sigma-70 family)